MPHDENDDLIDEEVIRKIKKHETPVDYMYLDTKGNVTLGTGRMIPNAEKAKSFQLRYEDRDNGRYATARETEQAFKKVQADKYGKNIGYQYFKPDGQKFDKIYVDNATKEAWLLEDLQRSKRELQQKFEDFDEFPRSAQKALLDMQFNMGDPKFQVEIYDAREKKMKPAWPKLFKAIENKDWKTAGDESHREGIGEERNTYTKDLFYDAHSKQNK